MHNKVNLLAHERQYKWSIAAKDSPITPQI